MQKTNVACDSQADRLRDEATVPVSPCWPCTSHKLGTSFC